MTIALCILFSPYLIMIVYLMIGWQKSKWASDKTTDLARAEYSIAALIPFRNEEEKLSLLLEDLLAMDGDISPLQIILIDDHCTDGTLSKIEPFLGSKLSIKLIQSEGEGKVAALKTGLKEARTDHIITLDADIRLNSDWYGALQGVLNAESDMCILPVLGISEGGLASSYAQLDFMSLIGVTYAMAAHSRPVMANGAQLLIKREQAGWSDELVSGDDVFALHGIKAKGGSISYALSERLVARTAMPSSWKGVWSQRLRWASKAVMYQDSDTLVLGWIVLAVNVGLWVLFFWSLFHPATFYLFLTMLLFKAILDLAFLIPVMRWFRQGRGLYLFPLSFLLNFIQYPLIFLAGRFIGFSWKDRNYCL